MSIIRKSVPTLLYAALIAVAILVATACVFGLRPVVVAGASMEPTIHIGSVLLIERVDPSSVSPGDVITYAADRSWSGAADPVEITTHRVTSIGALNGAPAFRTRGDANDSPDEGEVAASAVLGRVVFAVPYAGYFGEIARSRVGFIALVALPALLLVSMEVAAIVREARRLRPQITEGRARGTL